ncbi:F0F1 ATP synthase subunit delta [Methylocystis sp. WRRC1]|uniref:F0F1 ATP synthase subunit delta n=1 Tax=unclassified Methylocystis TaxID=2625913 RepID=UPI0001F88896|nr:F0F1 ATP synthase subunit delta [Methylocystis sp. ATCC 49242]MCC3246225.1 F0F1 ATP synthase subunit delta [Methylocystis sp. WRRC1]
MAQDGVSLSGVAGRYASALYELATEKRAADEVAAALAAFQTLVNDSADLKRLVRSPVFSAQEQVKALDAVLNKAGISGIAANFIRLVASKRRLFVISDMIDAYQSLHDASKGLVRADVTVAAPLRPEQATALRQTLSGVTGGKSINLNIATDPSIIGGIIVKLGSRMVDASVRTKLNAIRTRMKEVG